MTNQGQCPCSLVIERVFPHPQAKLWRALTESALLAQWMMNNDFEPVAGKKFQFLADPMPNWNGIVDCEVVLVDPIQRLSYNWGVGNAESGMQWVVALTLTPAVLTLVGPAAMGVSTERRNPPPSDRRSTSRARKGL